MRYPFLRREKIAAAADRLCFDAFGGRDQISYPLDLHALVFDYLCEHENLVFNDERDLGEEDGDPILGKMRPFSNTVLISAPLKHRGPTGRYRFTVAHEIGHWVLHRPLFLASESQQNLFTANAGEGQELISLHRNVFPSAGSRPPREEWQANRFAIELLLEKDLLREAFVERFEDPPIALHTDEKKEEAGTMRGLARELAAEKVHGRPPLQDLFGLSAEAMAIALEARGYVVENPPLT